MSSVICLASTSLSQLRRPLTLLNEVRERLRHFLLFQLLHTEDANVKRTIVKKNGSSLNSKGSIPYASHSLVVLLLSIFRREKTGAYCIVFQLPKVGASVVTPPPSLQSLMIVATDAGLQSCTSVYRTLSRSGRYVIYPISCIGHWIQRRCSSSKILCDLAIR